MNVKSLLMGASALVAASVAAAGGAHAQSQIYGGGSTLIGPYLRQAADCYGNPTQLVNQGASPYDASSPATTPTYTTVTPFNYTGSPAFNCASQHVNSNVQINYIGSGSGNGELGVFTHDVATDVGYASPGNLVYPSIQYGAGDYGISGSEVAAYNNGGQLSQTTGGGAPVYVNAPNGSQPTTPASGSLVYNNPRVQYGAFIQFPISVDPVAIAYSPVYKEVADASGNVTYYKFKIKSPNKDGSGGLRLDIPTLCGIFNGQITNWNNAALTTQNGGVSLKDPADPAPFSVPLELVGRNDSSGTTSIFYRALAAQCTTANGYSGTNNYAAAGSKKLPTPLQGPVYTSSNPNQPSVNPGSNGNGSGVFTRATGSGGVAQYTAFTAVPAAGQTIIQGRLAYIGPDFALPAVTVTGANTYGLNVADLKPGNGATTYLEPLGKNAIKAFGTGNNAILPPQSNQGGVYEDGSSGHVPPANSHGVRSAPQDWAEPISTTVTYSTGETTQTPLADPNAYLNITTAYPLVGTTNAFLNTCYATADEVNDLKGFFSFYLNTKTAPKVITDPTKGLLVEAGLNPLPTSFQTAALQTFFVPTLSGKTNTLGTDSLSLNILPVGTPANSRGFGGQCASVSPGA